MSKLLKTQREFLALVEEFGATAKLVRRTRHFVWEVTHGDLKFTVVSPISPSDTNWIHRKRNQLKRMIAHGGDYSRVQSFEED